MFGSCSQSVFGHVRVHPSPFRHGRHGEGNPAPGWGWHGPYVAGGKRVKTGTEGRAKHENPPMPCRYGRGGAAHGRRGRHGGGDMGMCSAGNGFDYFSREIKTWSGFY